MASASFRERLRPWRRLSRQTPPAERLEAVAADGQVLALWRVKPNGPSRGAVLLQHGLGANRFAFHWPGRSVAAFLAARGFDCFVSELRGAGASLARAPGWTFFDYLEQDFPALLAAVRGASGEERVHLVGHSMGGILVMCHGLLGGGSGVASATALGSALDYSLGASGFAPLLRTRRLVERIPAVPWGAAMAALAPFLGRLDDPLAGFNFHPGNAEPSVVRAVYANAFGSIPTALLRTLATGFEPGGLQRRSGEPFLLMPPFDAPLLCVAASDDRQCPLVALEATAAALGGQVERFGAAFGSEVDYGHFDLLLGRTAPAEVWPRLAAWLESHA